jgi:hypothetical protein
MDFTTCESRKGACMLIMCKTTKKNQKNWLGKKVNGIAVTHKRKCLNSGSGRFAFVNTPSQKPASP